MKLSIVTTLYKSASYLKEFYVRVSSAAQTLVGEDYEIIFVNDGSPDNSLDLTVEFSKQDSHVVVVDLSRNFGHHKAMMAGLEQSKGKYIFLVDCDLEEDPEWLVPFSETMEDKGCDVVYGIQEQRKGHWFERWSGDAFYSLFRIVTRLNLPRNSATARLMTRRYVDALLRHREREVFIAGLWLITGFKQCPHTIKKHSTSETTYNFRRKISIFVNAVTSFSNTPLVVIFYTGLLISLFSMIYILYLVFSWLWLESPLSGWTSVMASIWLLGGMIISFIGVVGVYLSKIFSETKQRPYTIVREIYEKK